MNHERLAMMAGLLACASGVYAQTARDSELQSAAQAMLAQGPACGQAGNFSNGERRLLQKAAQGVDALRDYVYITRGIHRYDMMEFGAWMEARRAESGRCEGLTAQATRSDADPPDALRP